MTSASRSTQRLRRRSVRQRRPSPLAVAVGTFLVVAIALGGGADWTPLTFVPPALLGTAVLALAVRRGGFTRLAALPRLTVLTILLVTVLPLIQLVPLPHALWTALPGRSLADAVLAASGQPEAWRPLTLAVTATLGALIVYLWMLGLLLAFLVMEEGEVRGMLWVVVAMGALHLAIGAMQFLSHGDRFVFYRVSHRGALIGFFANKNHASLFIALVMLFGYSLLSPARLRDRRVQLAAAGIVLVLLIALIATLSRAGFAFGLFALGFMVVLQQFGRRKVDWRWVAGGVTGVALVLILVTTSAAATRIFDRFGDVTGDVRQLFWIRSWPLVLEYFPFGGGLGSFPTLFAISEHLDWLDNTYLNHVHNDYMELLIEAGVPGALAILLVAVGVVRHGRSALREWRTPAGRRALIGLAAVVLCLLHSVVDYPLRRLAIAAMFTLAWGLVLRLTEAKSIA